MVWKRSKDGGFSTDEAWLNINIASSIVATLILILAFSLYGGKVGLKLPQAKQFGNYVQLLISILRIINFICNELISVTQRSLLKYNNEGEKICGQFSPAIIF